MPVARRIMTDQSTIAESFVWRMRFVAGGLKVITGNRPRTMSTVMPGISFLDKTHIINERLLFYHRVRDSNAASEGMRSCLHSEG